MITDIDNRAQREHDAIHERMQQLGLAYGAPNEQAHNIAVATVVLERAINRLAVHVERIADMFEHVIDRERASVRVDHEAGR